MLVKRIFLFLHEADIDRKGIDVFAYLLTESFDIVKTCSIFFCRNNTTRLWNLVEGLVDELDVLCLETMMVSKRQWRDILN